MRVIAGTARGRKLKAPRGSSVRPASQRVKKSLFDILAWRIAGARVLDLYAGTGSLAIEALSRGAQHAFFVEKDGRCIRAIQENLQTVGFSDLATVRREDVLQFLTRNEKMEPFDVVFIDPPYRQDVAGEVLRLLAQGTLVVSDGIVVIEHASTVQIPADTGVFSQFRQQTFGQTRLTFLEPAG